MIFGWTMDDVMDLVLAQWGVPEIVQWPVRKGNGVVIAHLMRRTANRAKVGDRIKCADGGYIQRIPADGWVQWEFHEDAAAEPLPPQGRVLHSKPAELPGL